MHNETSRSSRPQSRLGDFASRVPADLRKPFRASLNPGSSQGVPWPDADVCMAAAALVMQRLTGAEHGLLVLQAHAAPAFLACAAQEQAQGLVERARDLALQHATSTEQAAIDLVWLTDPARETEAQAQFPSALLLAFHPQAEVLQIASTGAYPEDFVQALLRTIHQVARVIQAHPAERVDQIDLLGVNSAWLTAALFNAIVDDDPHWFHGLAQLLTGGEALSVAHVRRALDALPHTALLNGYGPTECTTFTATYRIPHLRPDDTLSIPIGQPIQDTHVLICSASGELLPRGMVGELCAGGRGVADGYLNRPDLTSQRFIADPLNPQGKLYRTGDLVRWRPDGMLEFVGRVGLRRGRPPKRRARPAARRLCGASGGCKLRSGGLAAGAGQRRLHHLPTRQRLSLPGRRAALATLDQPHETDLHTKSHR